MRKSLVALTLLITLALGPGAHVPAQQTPAQKAPAGGATTSPAELARAAVAALGGEKFRNMKSMVQSGSAELFLPGSNESVRGEFAISLDPAGRYRIEVNAGFSFQQISNGSGSYSSFPRVELPDPSKHGLSQLARYDQPGYKVTAIPDKDKMRGFRIKSPDGSTTDFFADAATGRVRLYTVLTASQIFDFELKDYQEVEGIPVPVDFTMKMEATPGLFTLNFKVKETKINQPLAADVFAIPQ